MRRVEVTISTLLISSLFTQVRGETVWKIGMGPESGLRKRPRGVEGVPIGHFLDGNKHGQDAFGYFPNSFSEYFIDGTSANRLSQKFVCVLRRAAVLPILPAALFVFEPVLVLLAVGHGGACEGFSFGQLLLSPSCGCEQVGPT